MGGTWKWKSKSKTSRTSVPPKSDLIEFLILTMKFLIFLTTLSILGLAQGEKCQNPKVQASSYTPSDAQVLTHIAFVAEFSLSCSNGASNVALYADLNGALVPVVRSQDAGGRYQISWTTEVKHAKTGDHEVNLYDEEGYTAAKGALDQLGAARRRPLHPGFLLGLLLKVRAFGLVLAKPELRGDEVHRKQLVVPHPAARKLVSIISPLSKSALLLFVTLKPHNDDQDVLAIEAPPSARRLFFHEQSSLHRKYLENFDFIFGLHINLFRSLAYRLISIGTINAF